MKNEREERGQEVKRISDLSLTRSFVQASVRVCESLFIGMDSWVSWARQRVRAEEESEELEGEAGSREGRERSSKNLSGERKRGSSETQLVGEERCSAEEGM